MQKSDRARFLGKTPFWAISAQKGQKISLFAVSQNFDITFGSNLCRNVLHMVTNQTAPFVSPFLVKNALGQSDLSILKLRYLLIRWAEFSDFLQCVRIPGVEKCEREIIGVKPIFRGQNGFFFSFLGQKTPFWIFFALFA